MNKEQFFTSIQGKTVTFCGIGRSHMPLIRLFQEKGALVSARDKRSLEELGDNGKALQEWGVQLILGENYLEDLREDIIFRTPGMKYHLPQLEAARMLTYYAADLKEQGVPFTKQAAMAKLFAAEASHKVVDTALQIHGGYGYMKEYAIERIYRDQRITELFEGTSQVQKIVIAGQLLH